MGTQRPYAGWRWYRMSPKGKPPTWFMLFNLERRTHDAYAIPSVVWREDLQKWRGKVYGQPAILYDTKQEALRDILKRSIERYTPSTR